MPTLTTTDVVRFVGDATSIGNQATAASVVADSRAVSANTAFVAIRGGHGFVGDAFAAGAPFAIVEDRSCVPDGTNAVVVGDTVDALMRIAAGVRARMLDVDVIGITGSTGKTLTKDFIAAVMSQRSRVHATPNSFNAEIGVPLTLLGASDDVEVLVVEVAARRQGEIAELCEIVRPRVGVITGIGAAHIEIFGSRDAIAATKSELLTSLPADGVAIVPSTDDFLDTLASSTDARLSTVGPGGHVRYRADRVDEQGRTHGRVWLAGNAADVVLPVPGRALMRNAALAMAVGQAFGVDPALAAAGIADAPLSAWRMQLEQVGGWTVVNDAWNSNPTSAASALHTVAELAAGRPMWAVLGRMAELGDLTEDAHRRLGRLAAALGYAGVIVVGEAAAGIADGAGPIAQRVDSLAEAAGAVGECVPDGAVIVVKASRVAGLEKLVDELAKSTERIT